ncbi:MAG: hypothetical protein U1A53_17005 [Prosthecobacter sp.]|nr:hypothetical protein [Prosthecobacter sp.]
MLDSVVEQLPVAVTAVTPAGHDGSWMVTVACSSGARAPRATLTSPPLTCTLPSVLVTWPADATGMPLQFNCVEAAVARPAFRTSTEKETGCPCTR